MFTSLAAHKLPEGAVRALFGRWWVAALGAASITDKYEPGQATVCRDKEERRLAIDRAARD